MVAQTVKNSPAMQETGVWSLRQEYPLEKGMATHSSILAWRIPWAEEPGRLQSMGSQRVGHDWATSLHLPLGRKVMTNLDSIFKSRDITLPTNVYLVQLWFFQWSCIDVRVGLWRRLSTEELMLLNCGVGEDSWESLGLQGDPTSPF